MKIQIGTPKNPTDVQLLPERALYWPKKNLICLGDVHLGKAEALQSFGINLPKAEINPDLQKMKTLIEKFKPDHVLILGDLIHHKKSWTESLYYELKDFLSDHDWIQWTLIAGNHERGSKSYLSSLPMEILNHDFVLDGIHFSHGHESFEGDFQIQGHVHPVIKIQEGSTKLRVPCFALNEKNLILPSFGTLTGGYEIEAKKFKRVLACGPDFIFEVNPRPQSNGSNPSKESDS